MKLAQMRLAHGWILDGEPESPGRLIAEFIRPAVSAIPSPMAQRLGACRVAFPHCFANPSHTSEWTEHGHILEIAAATGGIADHDIAMEVLSCLGQALWERLLYDERTAFWKLLDAEIHAGVPGEIDEEALAAKRRLLAGHAQARSNTLLEYYGRASFAATAAEYVHALWHDVSVRTGPDYLPAPQLRRRLELLARWFPPDEGYELFAAEPRK